MKNGSARHWFFTVVTQRPGLQVHGEATGSNPSLQLMRSIQKLPCKSHPVPMNLSDKLKLPQQIMGKICLKYNAPVRLHKGTAKRKGVGNVWAPNHALQPSLRPHRVLSLTLASLVFQERIRVLPLTTTSPPRVKGCCHLGLGRSWDDGSLGFSPLNGWMVL